MTRPVPLSSLTPGQRYTVADGSRSGTFLRMGVVSAIVQPDRSPRLLALSPRLQVVPERKEVP